MFFSNKTFFSFSNLSLVLSVSKAEFWLREFWEKERSLERTLLLFFSMSLRMLRMAWESMFMGQRGAFEVLVFLGDMTHLYD